MNLRISIALLLVISSSWVLHAQDLTRYVDPMTGTGGVGHTYPGATLPYGMVQLSPDTRRDASWEGCAGYYHADSLVYGFTHTHLSGTGCSDYGDILVMPFTGAPDFNPEAYASRYRHSDERSEPGYYAVYLSDDSIRADFTSTERTGLHRYRYPATNTDQRQVLIDLRHRDKTLGASFRYVSPTRVEGYRHSEAWAKDQYVFFCMEFSQPVVQCLSNREGKILKQGMQFEGSDLAFALRFANGKGPVMIKVGISTVDADGARKNLQSELPGWDFERVRMGARAAWNRELSRIRVSGSDREDLVNFYTALYHTMVVPNVISDVDGRYRGRDNRIHTAKGHKQYTVFSLWDTFRAAHPLYALIDKPRTLDYIRTFLNQYKQGGRLPVWELGANETDCMIGYHSIPVITDALVKGIGGFDTLLAFEAMKKSANWNHYGLPAYVVRGYMGVEDEHESVSKTLEYAYDDWCIAEVARMLRKGDEMNLYYRRASSYRNVYDAETGFMRPRRNGGFLPRFDPREVNNHYTEANSWQYSFFVPQDIPGLIDLMGGPDEAEKKLDGLFTASSQTTGRTQADITGLIGQYAHGNEPSHHMAYLYNYIGKPWKTQRLVRQIMDSLYHPGPEGLPGNEDCGQMSAWFVWSAMGFYPVTPGSPYYAIGTPLFDTALVSLEPGKTLRIVARRETSGSRYVKRLSIDGKPVESNLITHQELLGAKEIKFELVAEPYLNRGITPERRGAMPNGGFTAAPVITAKDRLFPDSMQITLSGTNIRYSTSGDSLQLDKTYEGPFTIHASTVVHARCMGSGVPSGLSSAAYFKVPSRWEVVLHSTPNRQYMAEGPASMIDGIRGSTNWRKGDWHGYQGQDMDVEIRFDQVQEIRTVETGFLQDVRPWIFYPKDMRVEVSEDGVQWRNMGQATHAISDSSMDAQQMVLRVEFSPVKAKAVRIKASNYGKLPAWHPGAGFDAFIFCDEIIVR